MNPDTIAIIVAVLAVLVTVLGTGLALWRAIDSRYKDLRQDIKETNSRIDSMEGRLNSRIDALDSRIDTLDARFTARIDALYQALFSHKKPAA